MILAGIDIGTNTLRLLIADTDQENFSELYSDRRITRLGRDLDRTGTLSRQSENLSLAVLADFADAARRYKAEHTAAVGTSALRTASNTPSFISSVKRKTGITIRVIDGKEEARLTLRGVVRSLSGIRDRRSRPLHDMFVIDIGGGSTELIVGNRGGNRAVESLPLGAVYLTDRFIAHDPPLQQEITRMRSAIRDELRRRSHALQLGQPCICVGTAGTITTLASVDQGLPEFDPARINGYVLTRDRIAAMVESLGEMSAVERKGTRGLDPGREDIILAGGAITLEIIDHFGCASITVSDWGLREGIVLDLYDRVSRQNSTRDGKG